MCIRDRLNVIIPPDRALRAAPEDFFIELDGHVAVSETAAPLSVRGPLTSAGTAGGTGCNASVSHASKYDATAMFTSPLKELIYWRASSTDAPVMLTNCEMSPSMTRQGLRKATRIVTGARVALEGMGIMHMNCLASIAATSRLTDYQRLLS